MLHEISLGISAHRVQRGELVRDVPRDAQRAHGLVPASLTTDAVAPPSVAAELVAPASVADGALPASFVPDGLAASGALTLAASRVVSMGAGSTLLAP